MELHVLSDKATEQFQKDQNENVPPSHDQMHTTSALCFSRGTIYNLQPICKTRPNGGDVVGKSPRCVSPPGSPGAGDRGAVRVDLLHASRPPRRTRARGHPPPAPAFVYFCVAAQNGEG
ncbi:hypothetical protein H6P81_014151 [Aristolochia fimbriata]|uniref:Uncharacterized protein n=1 Tax=Aristolochia fimbriata TaxID=158543 RepID=A0AAV7ELC5_ARIFI|nr:hypothetical protein H6P81_014151 [Aristolochia fimbriata]